MEPETEGGFTLQLLHVADQEAGSAAVVDAPNLSGVLNALRAEDVADSTLTLSSGDAFIPGVFLDASEAVFGAGGVADIQIQNELGLQAVALGNHEFDLGTRTLSELITGQDVTDDGDDDEPDTIPRPIATFDAPELAGTDLAGQAFGGTAFPYLSSNLLFGPDAFLGPLEAPGAQAPRGGVVTSSTIVEQDGERFGIVGATTPTLGDIASPGAVVPLPSEFDATPTEAQLDMLAGEIQTDVNQLLVAGVDKIVLLSHMQRLSIEEALAERLTGVDVIVAGGSNTRLVDETDRLRDGDGAQGTYPIFVDGADGSPTAIVNTDGSYRYVGRLVIEFDANGQIVPESYDPGVSGAYATDAQGVADLGAADDVDPEVQAIADAIGAQIEAAESNVFGTSEVFLNGNRSGTGAADDPDGVRTQETNLGNLTADANLAAAREADDAVVVSIKNGGGIRASIGETVVPPGGAEAVRSPNPALTDAQGEVFKPEGGISQNDIQTTLAFNNGLTLLTLTRADLVAVLEFGVSALPDVAGQFPQVAGVELAFDPDAPAGDRITDAAIVDEAGAVVAPLVRAGEIAGDPAEEFRIVTLSFLAGGGDGYPFDTLGTNRVDLFDLDGDGTDDDAFTGDATFAADGTEQDALAEFLDDLDAPFAEADTGPEADGRIQNLAFREADVFADEPPAPIPLVINEVLGSTTGTDSEYVELFGQAGTSLDGLSVIVVEGEDAGQIGDVNLRVDLGPDDAIGDNGFFLLANDTAAQTYGVTPDVPLAENAIENGAYTVALVETALLAGGAVTGDETVLDAVAVQGTAPATAFFGAPVLGPDGTFLPAGVGRVADGQDSDQASDFSILSFGNDPAVNTPTAGFMQGGGGGGEGSIDDEPTLISAIQGSEDGAALAGQTVVVEAVVTGDFQAGDADAFRTLDGFFLQEEGEDFDADDATSEGIFVLDGESPAVDVEAGDLVRVLGTVVERFGKTTIQATEVRVEEAGAVADPRDLAVETTLPGVEDREAIESMIVTVAEPLTFVESFDYEQFGEATLASGGPVFQFTQLNEPDADANAAYQAEVADRTITIDDGTDGRRGDLDPILRPDGEPFAVGQGIRMGQDLEDVTAIVDFGFGEYRLRLPSSEPFDPVRETNPRPDAPQDVGSDFKVSAFNVLNYFTTLDDGGVTDIGLDPRGAETPEELERQAAKLVTAITALDADVVGLVEIENDFAGEDLAIADLVARLNDEAGTQRWNWVDPGVEFVGTDAIAVGFLYDQTTVELVGDAAILDAPGFLDPLDDGDDSNGDETPEGDSFNRAALAQTFREIETGGEFTAAVNHFKSKGSPTGAPEDEDQGDGAGRNDATREAASEALLDWLDTDPTGSGDPDRMILGDLNAYAQEDPIAVLEAGGYTDLAQAFEGEDVTSYRFSGQVGTLDYALANGSLTSQVTGADTWNINSDELVIFDYNEESTFGTPLLRPDDQGLFDGTTAARASDHDPIVVGLDLEGEGGLPVVAGTAADGDRLRGTEADEILDGGGGVMDLVRGGGGSDVFRFTDVEGARDRLKIRDYTPGEDVLDVSDAGGVEAIAGSRDFGGFLLIRFGAPDRDAIVLEGVSDLAQITFAEDAPAV